MIGQACKICLYSQCIIIEHVLDSRIYLWTKECVEIERKDPKRSELALGERLTPLPVYLY
jgi:hypothetical protein